MQKKTITSKATCTVYIILRQITTLVPREFVNDAVKSFKTIQLTLDCFDWARLRRQKAAAKLHMTLGKKGQTLLYKFYYICLTVACGIWWTLCRHEEEKIAGNTRDGGEKQGRSRIRAGYFELASVV